MGFYDSMMLNDMSEADCMEDGADYITKDDIDDMVAWELVRQQLVFERKQREYDLIGKYIIVTNSRYQKDTILYLQDKIYGIGHWTKFLSNAIGYDTFDNAKWKVDKLKFNNPKVMYVDDGCKLKEVCSNGRIRR